MGALGKRDTKSAWRVKSYTSPVCGVFFLLMQSHQGKWNIVSIKLHLHGAVVFLEHSFYFTPHQEEKPHPNSSKIKIHIALPKRKAHPLNKCTLQRNPFSIIHLKETTLEKPTSNNLPLNNLPLEENHLLMKNPLLKETTLFIYIYPLEMFILFYLHKTPPLTPLIGVSSAIFLDFFGCDVS